MLRCADCGATRKTVLGSDQFKRYLCLNCYLAAYEKTCTPKERAAR